MSSLTNHLIRRGVEVVHASVGHEEGPEIDIPAWGSTLLLATLVFFGLVLCSIQYTYGELVATLASIEQPQSIAIIKTSSEDFDHPDAPLLKGDEKAEPIDQEILLIKQKPITSRFCAIRRHLRARGGRLARYRGLHIYILNGLLQNIVMSIVTPIFSRSFVAYTIADIATYTLFTRYELLWNHAVISEPSEKPWFRRFPTRAVAMKAVGATAMYAAITRLSSLAIIYVSMAFSNKVLYILKSGSMISDKQSPSSYTLFYSAVIIMVSLFVVIAIQIPAEISINRVRASLLSVEEETIVPFDRTFNGQVIPVSEGGRGVLGLWQAWAGCDLATRLRVLGVYMKVVAMQVFVMIFATLVLVGEVRLILGPEWLSVISAAYVSTAMVVGGMSF